MKKSRVLVFSDFDSIRKIIVNSIKSKGMDVIETTSYQNAIKELNGTSFSLVITDNDIRNDDGTKLVKYMRSLTSYLYTPILLLHSSKPEQLADTLCRLQHCLFHG
jgi:PleD family two-component response regulator